MFSKMIKATDKKKTTLNWWEYWIGHCWMTGWQTIAINFRMWGDLMGSNYDNYALLNEDDPLEECLDWFWVSLNEDDTYPKEFLEYLMQMVEDIETGKEELIPLDEVMDRLRKDLEEESDEETAR